MGFERCSTETGKSEIAQNRKLLQDGFPKYRETKPETRAEVCSRNSAVVSRSASVFREILHSSNCFT